MVLAPYIGIISLQLKTELKQKFVPEFTFHRYTMSCIMWNIKSSQQNRQSQQQVKQIEFAGRPAIDHQSIKKDIHSEVKEDFEAHDPIALSCNPIASKILIQSLFQLFVKSRAIICVEFEFVQMLAVEV